jgi:hypothetical protein
MRTNTMSFQARLANLGLLAGLLLGLGGCPLQTPAAEVFLTGQAGIDVTASAVSPTVNQTITLTASPHGAAVINTSSATWSTSDSSVVSLNGGAGASITAVAHKIGSATITASAGGATGSVKITVIAQVGNVEVTGATSLDLGAESTYTAAVTDLSGKTIAAPVTWSAVGSVQVSGSAGTATTQKIRASALDMGTVSATAGNRTGAIQVNVSLGNATLSVAQADGTAFPTSIAGDQQVVARAQWEGQNKVKAAATDAQWSATGACSLGTSQGAQAQVIGNGSGTCTVTASSRGKTAKTMFNVVTVTAIKVTGDTTGALKLGASRTFTAVAMADATEVASVPVTWSQSNGALALAQGPSGTVTVTGAAVGQAMLTASVGAVTKPVTFGVDPVSLEIAASGTRVLMGGGATITVTPKGASTAGKFLAASGVALTGATGFDTVGAPVLTGQGLVTFTLSNATAESPSVKATYGTVTSNALAFSLSTVGTVVVSGPASPVRVGAKLDLSVTVKDNQGMTIAGGVPVTWADANGVLTVPSSTDIFSASATVSKLGASSLVATVRGVASAPYVVSAVPGMVILAAFQPTSVPVGGTATAAISVTDTNGVAISGITAAQLSVTSGDTSKVTVGSPTAVGQAFQVTATGVAVTGSPIALTAKWSNGTDTVTSTPAGLSVAAGTITWVGGACAASPLGPKTWRVSGFQGASAGGNAIVYDVYAALGTAASTASTKVASDGAAGVAKDVTVASVGADWRFGVVARASDGATSALVTCARGTTVASSAVAGNAFVLGSSGIYADDTASAVSATNPRPLFVVADATSKTERTAPRTSLSFGGGLVGIGASASDAAQVLYKRPATGEGADSYALPTVITNVKTDSSGGVCKSRAGVTAFELAGKATSGGALTSFAVYTTTATATGDAADCALNVLAFRDNATKTIASGVDAVAAFGDHRLGYLYAGALFDVDLTSNSKVPRQLADDGLAVGSLLSAVNPTSGTAGAIEATSVYVLSPTGVVSRYTMGAPPLAAPEVSAATAALAGADGFVAVNASTLFVTVNGTLKVVTVSGAGALTLSVAARDYSMFGTSTLPVTLGASTGVSP